MTIRGKILTGCLLLTLLTGALGLYTQDAARRLGGVALNIYDNGFMAVSYLRSAEIGFARLAASAGTSSSAREAEDMLSDLDVVRERAMSEAGRRRAAALQAEVRAVLPLLHDDPAAVRAVQNDFERLVERFADDGFTYRRGVAAMVHDEIAASSVAIWASVLLALMITLLVSHLIVPPVRAAVRIASSIAGGNLDNPISVTGRGETADLMRALRAMQASIASGLARIRTLMDEQAAAHESELAVRHAQMAAALGNMSQGLCLFDEAGKLLVANARFGDMFGAPVVGATCEAVLRAAGLGLLVNAAREDAVASIACTLPDGRAIAVTQSPVAGGGWVATYEDVTERHATERRLAHMVRHDQLTGLPNRLYFAEHMRALLDPARLQGGSVPGVSVPAGSVPAGSVPGAALLCIDLDGFKVVNDTLGHPVGDALLCEAGTRLRTALTEAAGEDAVVVRLGGDEFAIVLREQGGEETLPELATRVAQRVVAVLGAPFALAGHNVVLGGSVGIALSEDGSADAEHLLKSADLALYRAKAEGRGVWRFFEADMDMRMQARRQLEQDLREAVAQEQFELFYQPLMQGTEGVAGFEALIRWRHPTRGLVSPAEFIPLAEEVGLIPVIGRWVLQRACQDAARWPARLKVAVNLSPMQFRGDLVGEVRDALDASGLDPTLLELEITESIMLGDEAQVLATLHALRALGARIAMDDFGTGYSSLGYLRRFPFDKIKIDQSFVRSMTESSESLAIVRAVIGLGHSLGMAVHAEGVETDDQCAALISDGCLELQGFLFSKPQPAEEVFTMLRRLGCVAAPSEGEIAPRVVA